MATIFDILNTIRDNASVTYQDRVPEATRTNIEDIRFAMLEGADNVVVSNEFMGTLINMLIKQVVHNKLFENPLKSLKKGKKPTGDTVQEIYNNFLKGETFDSAKAGSELLSRKLPDTKSVYHRMNRKDLYEITVGREELAKAFRSFESLDSYIQNLINTLYNSAELDEYLHTKQLIQSAINKNAIVVKTFDKADDPCVKGVDGKEFISLVKSVSGLMEFPSTEFNAYTLAQSVDTKPLTTFSKKSEQILILDVITDTKLNVVDLANIFNMSVAEFNETKKIVIDRFPDPTIRGALVDEKFFQIYDDQFTVESFRNPKGLYTNYYLHVWETLAYSILVNAVVFKVAE